MNKIYIHRGDSTVFADIQKFLTFIIDTELDLTGWTAKFILGFVTIIIPDISLRQFDVNLTQEDTNKLKYGPQHGALILTDNKGNVKTVCNTIPFEVTNEVIENEHQIIDLTIPTTSGVDLKLEVGYVSVASVNGKKGEVVLTAEDVGALPDSTIIPDLTDYVKNTDYVKTTSAGLVNGTSSALGITANSNGQLFINLATDVEIDNRYTKYRPIVPANLDYAVKSGVTTNTIELTDEEKANARTWLGAVGSADYGTDSKVGLVKGNSVYGITVFSGGMLVIQGAGENDIKGKGNQFRPITPKSMDYALKNSITTNTIELTEDEKASAKNWLGYATPTDIMQAIASIPQFKLSIVDALPETGEKMTLYFVPKEGADNDIYNEYVWIEQTSSYEFLGSTAVDLTDYVKKTDYATKDTYGVVKVNTTGLHGVGMNDSAGLYVVSATEQQITAKTNGNRVISPRVLDYAVKTSVTTNTIELTDDEKTSARTWLGAVGNADYASNAKAGLVRGYLASGFSIDGIGEAYCATKTLEQYNTAYDMLFISKGTLDNVLTQYAKTVSLTQADYDALETKDANTLYLIEE